MNTGFLIVVMFFGFILAVIGLCLFSFTKEELAEFRKLSKIKKFRWVLVKLLLFVVGVTGVFIILWAMQTCGKDVTAKKEKIASMEKEYQDAGYFICDIYDIDFGTKESSGAISKDDMEAYKLGNANVMTLYTIPERTENILKTSQLDGRFIIKDVKDMYNDSDCYKCNIICDGIITRIFKNGNIVYIPKDEVEKYRSGEKFVMTIYGNKGKCAELLSSDSIDSLEIMEEEDT